MDDRPRDGAREPTKVHRASLVGTHGERLYRGEAIILQIAQHRHAEHVAGFAQIARRLKTSAAYVRKRRAARARPVIPRERGRHSQDCSCMAANGVDGGPGAIMGTGKETARARAFSRKNGGRRTTGVAASQRPGRGRTYVLMDELQR